MIKKLLFAVIAISILSLPVVFSGCAKTYHKRKNTGLTFIAPPNPPAGGNLYK